MKIIISGCGPAGLTLAKALLYKAGQVGKRVDIHLLEKAPQLNPTVGGIISMK